MMNLKPIKLVICGFGPFGKENIVLFDELMGQGLFLITGDTGSGKTTIFDAICFALFGEVSGSTRTVDTVRSDFAEEEIKTYVLLEFEQKGKIYSVKRNPRYLKKKRNSSEMTTKSADADLTLSDGTVITGYKAVTLKIEDILGISAKQFKQIVMVAQGEFLKLILAESGERSSILRKIFQTDIFRKIQVSLKEEEKKWKSQLSASEQTILDIMDENFQSLHMEKPTHSEDVKDFLKHLQDSIEVDTIAVGKYKLERLKLKEELQKNIEDLIEAQHDNQLFDALDKAQQDYKNLLRKKEEIDLCKKELENQEKAFFVVFPKEEIFLREKEQQETLILDLEQLKSKINLQNEVILKLEKQFEEAREKGNILNSLQEEISQLKQQEPLYQTTEHLFKELQEKIEEVKNYSDQETVLQRKQSEVLKYKDNIVKTLEKYETVEVDKASVEVLLDKIMNKKQLVEGLLEEEKQLFQQQEDYNVVQKLFYKLEEEYQQKKEKCDRAETMFLREQAGILAKQLIDGIPCPVCGSLEHPQKASFSGEAPTEEELNQLKQDRENGLKELQKVTNQCNTLKSTVDIGVENIRKKMEGIIPFHIQDQFKERIQYLKGKLVQIQNKEKEEKERISVLEKYICEKKDMKIELAKQEEIIDSLSKEIEEINDHKRSSQMLMTEKKAAYTTIKESLLYDSLQEMQDVRKAKEKERNVIEDSIKGTERELQKAKEKQQSYLAVKSNNENKLLEIAERLEDAKKEFTKVLYNAGFQEVEEYHNYLCTQEILEKNRRRIKEFERDFQRINDTVEHFEKETQGKQKKELKNFMNEKQKLEEQTDRIHKKIEDISLQLNKNNLLHKRILLTIKEREHAEKGYLLVTQLSKTANGELQGKGKLGFEQFVQTFYFDQIIYEANQKLSIMTEGRYELNRKKNAEDLRSQYGLDLEVMDYYTGKIRSVKSLSGGEAFKASLCLALGLSEVIQMQAGGVEIDTMFIDEGFGALDEESLEQAIKILQNLSFGNRMIGIISHVTELKERISNKIVVQKGIHGSYVKVMASTD